MSGDSQELSCLFVGLKPLGIMKETYTLKDMIEFWQRQMKMDFAVIEAIVNLIEFSGIENDKKEDIIKELLRNHGLFEIGYKEDRTFIIEDKQLPVVEVEFLNPFDFSERGFEVIIEVFHIRILNSSIQFSMILN